MLEADIAPGSSTRSGITGPMNPSTYKDRAPHARDDGVRRLDSVWTVRLFLDLTEGPEHTTGTSSNTYGFTRRIDQPIKRISVQIEKYGE